MMHGTPRMRIQILLFDGFDELDAIAPFEVLRAASLRISGLQVELVAADGPRDVTAQYGVCVRDVAALDPGNPPDLLIVPGGGWATRAERGAWAEYRKGDLPDRIRGVFDEGAIVASVCTGAMLLARAGLLAGRKATTHHQAIADLEAEGVEVVRGRIVDEGRVITAGGVTSGLDLALWILERIYGPEAAGAAAAALEFERRGEVIRAAAV